MAFSPDGATLAFGMGDGSVRLLDMKSREARRDLHGPMAKAERVEFFRRFPVPMEGAAGGSF